MDSAALPIAKLLPVGKVAEEALDQILSYEHLSDYHKGFIHVVPPGERAQEDELDPAGSSGTDYETDQISTESTVQQSGYYLLSFDHLMNVIRTLSWRVGKGTSKFSETDRGVDLMVICPGKNPKGVAVNHALIQFHLDSGMLMLTGVSKTRPVKYLLNNETLVLYEGDKHVLFQRINRFCIGMLEYDLIYTALTDTDYAQYVVTRNSAFVSAGRPPPHTHLWAVPRQDHLKRGPFIFHRSLSSGRFGWVYAAVHSRTGAPHAIKELGISTLSESRQVLTEIHISTSFTRKVGLLQAQEVMCEHSHDRPCGVLPEKVHIVLPLARGDFSKEKWFSHSLPLIITLLRGPLQGLKTLHEAGYMHRDVTIKNMLVISIDPPQAVLCDYGKVIRAQQDSNSHLGPLSTLAPEVDGETLYDNKIDVWSMAWAWCWIFFPEYQHNNVDSTQKMDIVWYCGIMEELSRFSIRGESERSLAELLQQMLAWKPENRISAAEALLHPCMQFAIGSQRTEAEAVRDNQPSPSTGEKRQRTASPPEPHKRDPSRPELPQAEPDLRRRE